jgi:hypothetical protein
VYTYVIGLQAVFAITIAAFCVATVIGFFGSWKKLRGDELKKAAGGVYRALWYLILEECATSSS